MTVLSKNANYTVSTADGADQLILVDASGGARTMTLYTAVGNAGKKVTIIKADASANLATIQAASGETIIGQSSISLDTQYYPVIIVSDGANWFFASSV
jgi:hypothetical protein